MTEVVGVKFKEGGNMYYFAPNGLKLSIGENAIVETARGLEYGSVVLANKELDDSEIVSPLKNVVRKATKADDEVYAKNKEKEKEALHICEKKVAEHGLEMQLVDVEYTFDRGKILFYFTADGRVDFRELVKDLAGTFRTRIELRQIGVRDEAKMIGGLGICGRPFCCCSFLEDFKPVSVKMAKEQNMSLNPGKISGTCGRLMCCLKYEEEAYRSLWKVTPKVGAQVKTPDGKGTVTEVSLLRGDLKVTLDKAPESVRTYKRSDVKLLKDGDIKVGKTEMEDLKELE
ncbi:MAG: stage 0 sporulation family protein [Clostridia bacterium]|nr:stage 0 sporulation family protein [Clostridia bacterium]